MKYKVYSPTVEAYVMTDSGFYDLTDDIISGDITRNLDAPSTFNLTLQNKQNKWNGTLHTMDRITIYATKRERYQLLTGYISSHTSFTLFGEDFNISGYDTLYQLQNYYWNPNTVSSESIIGDVHEVDSGELGTGQQRVLGSLLTKIAGWNVSNVHIGAVPGSWIDWATKLYSMNVGDASGNETYRKFVELLGKGPSLSGKLASTDTSATGYAATGNVIADACAWAVAIANDSSHGYDQSSRWGPDYDCSSFVLTAFKQAGVDIGNASYTNNMIPNLTNNGQFSWIAPCPDESGLQKGDILLNINLHAALYLGDGQMVEAVTNEFGANTGGQTGDQTGQEIRVGSLWGMGGYWDGILRYNG